MISRFLSGVIIVIAIFGAGASAYETAAVQTLGIAPNLHLPKEMPSLYDACRSGDKVACTKFQVLMNANRQHHKLWRRYRPEYFQLDLR